MKIRGEGKPPLLLLQEALPLKWNSIKTNFAIAEEVSCLRRPLPSIACGLLLGILFAAIGGFWAVTLAVFFCLLTFLRGRWRGWLPLCCALLFGVIWLLVRSPIWPGDYGLVKSTLVVEQVEVGESATRLTVAVRSLRDQAVPPWNPVRAVLYLTEGQFTAGEVLTGEIDWQAPELPKNPGEFDFATYERRQGILATCFLSSSSKLQTVGAPLVGELPLRATLLARAQQIPGAAGELLATLLLGSSAGDWAAAWRQAGLAHVLAVSGLHVGLLLGMFLGLLTWFKVPPRYRYLLAACLLLGYGYLLGPRASVWRAIIMALIGLLALATGRLRDWQTTLAAAAILLLIYNPWWLFDAGFQLSFAATWGVLALAPLITARLPLLPWHLDRLLGTSLAAQAATLPLVLYHFYLFTPLALFSNLLVVPLLPIILALGLIYLLLSPLAGLLGPLMGFVLNALLSLVEWLAAIPAMSISPGQPPLWLVCLAIALLIALWLNQRPQAVRWLATGWVVVILLSLGWHPVLRFMGNRYDFRVLSVGQGSANALHLPGGSALLFDVGGASASVGENIIVPYLRQQGTFSIAGIYLSHLHADHIVGLADVCAAFPVKYIYVAEQAAQMEGFLELSALADQYGIPIVTLRGGDEQQSQALHISVLHPLVIQSELPATNEDSMVLELRWPNLRLLLPGDLGSETEPALLPYIQLPLDVLVVAHHGSAYSSSEQFLNALSPALSIISTGPNNYGHPAPATVERLDRYSQIVKRTDQAGAVLIWTNLKDHGVGYFLRP